MHHSNGYSYDRIALAIHETVNIFKRSPKSYKNIQLQVTLRLQVNIAIHHTYC